MVTIGVIGSDYPEIEAFIRCAKSTYGRAVNFIPFQGEDLEREAAKAARQALQGEIDILMKGIVPTRTLLKGLLAEDILLDGRRLTHIARLQLPGYDRLLYLTDAALNIEPTLEEHVVIIERAITAAQNAGIVQPKVAVLSAAEQHNPKMPSAVRAEELTKRFQQREDALVHGPLSLDLALSEHAVRNKRYFGSIEGDADVLVVPTIDAGNAIYKALQLFSEAKIGGLIAGAKVPIVLNSRNDSIPDRLFALGFALEQVSKQR